MMTSKMTDLIAGRFRALEEPYRLRIIQVLRHGEMTVGEVVQWLDGNQPNVSRHLQILDRAGIVNRRRDEIYILYSLREPSVLKLCELVHHFFELNFRLGLKPRGSVSEDADVSFRENIDTSGPQGRAIVVIIGAIAELERSLIIERVRAGMRRARLEGTHIGRNPLILDHLQFPLPCKLSRYTLSHFEGAVHLQRQDNAEKLMNRDGDSQS
ncbi:MAG: metalloregulator ArsR/SmtB family transcription factor [Terracidiphilus sp.]|nr:metalloregulator ArsR/SmtB family transcription factor [Terracidiphilus sp.]MDR3798358.1 metalloregulator ArsR/SmtB family transcription factor [Terracidiphilus sp.]